MEEPPPSPPNPPRPGRRPRPPSNPPPPSDRQTRRSARNPATPPTSRHHTDEGSYDPGQGTSAQARERTESISSKDDEGEYLRRLRRLRSSDPLDFDVESSNDELPEPPPSPPPIAVPAPPASTGRIPEPLGGHVPASEDLAACPCDPPAGPCDAPTFDPPRQFTARGERTFSNRGGPVPQPQPQRNQRQEQPFSFSEPKPGNFSYRRRRPDVNAFFDILSEHLSL